MGFPHSTFERMLSLGLLVSALSLGSSCTRSGKQVDVQCSPGQTKGADGKCQATQPAPAPEPGPAPSPGPFDELPPEGETEQPSETPEDSGLLPGGTEDPVEPVVPSTNPPASNPPAANPPVANPPASNPPASNPPSTNPPASGPPATSTPAGNGTPATPVDPLTVTETVSALFSDAPKSSAEGPPLLALKLVTSPRFGKVARVAFSYSTGVTNAAYTYHKKVLTAAGTPLSSDGSLQIEISSLPVSVTFDWDGKKCDTGIVDVGFEAKTAKATCK